MPIGTPALTPLRDRSETAYRIEVIRQRLLALDQEVIRLGSIADSSSTAATVQSLNQQIRLLTIRVSALEGAAGVTDTLVIPAGGVVTQFDAVVPSGVNLCSTADPGGALLSVAPLGIATNGGVAGTPITIQRRGPISIASSTLTPGLAVYPAVGGGLTQAPSSAYAVPVGVATSASQIWVDPGYASLMVESAAPSDGYLPITYSLAKTLLGAAQGGDIVLYDEQGRAALASGGGAIIKASGA